MSRFEHAVVSSSASTWQPKLQQQTFQCGQDESVIFAVFALAVDCSLLFIDTQHTDDSFGSTLLSTPLHLSLSGRRVGRTEFGCGPLHESESSKQQPECGRSFVFLPP